MKTEIIEWYTPSEKTPDNDTNVLGRLADGRFVVDLRFVNGQFIFPERNLFQWMTLNPDQIRFWAKWPEMEPNLIVMPGPVGNHQPHPSLPFNLRNLRRN